MNLKEDKPNIKYKRNFKNVNWDEFKTILINKCNSTPSPETWTVRSMEKELSTFNALINEALDKVAPVRRVRIRPSYKIWWNEQLKLLKQEVNSLFKKFKRNANHRTKGI